ncbi:MAG: hypothetical protein MUO76_08095 [Anaerolineaceae bacterium]|nr:hypothetical protein [Anaerolineaceae bacterium]
MPPEFADIFGTTSILTVVSICVCSVLSLAGTIGITFVLIRVIRKKVGPDRKILENGIPARARILSVQQTGVMVNYQPQVVFTLDVQPPGGAPYQIQTKAVIPMVNIPQFQPGTEVPVKIHPTDPTKVVMDVYH